MAVGKASRRLQLLAAEVGAERAPYYVRRPIPPSLLETFPAEGWYWVPRDQHTAVFLGASEIDATLALHRIRNLQPIDD